MKITNKLIENQFRNAITELGYTVATSYNDVGALRMDKNIGGYNIELIISESGAVTHPFGDSRRKLTEFSEFLQSLHTYALHVKQNSKLFKKV